MEKLDVENLAGGKGEFKRMEQSMVMRMKRLRPGAEPPQRQTAGSAGFDLKACMEEPVTLKPGDRSTFCTGWAVEIPEGCVGLVFCRSGLGPSTASPCPTAWV